MALKVAADAVWESFTTTGTGPITPGGVIPGKGAQSFASAYAANDLPWYVADKGSQREVGQGTWNGTTLTRTTIFYSTNSGSAVDFAAGTGEIFSDVPAKVLDFLNLTEITVASATTCDIGAVQGAKIAISGTTTITSFGTSANKLRFVRFTGALTLTHNGTSLILKNGVNRTTAANDVGVYVSDSSGNWRELLWQPASYKQPVITLYTSGTGTHTWSLGCVRARVRMVGGGGGGSGSATGADNHTSGGAGGDTTFGSLTASGGGAGAKDGAGGAGGAASGGNLLNSAGARGGGVASTNSNTSSGGGSLLGAGGGDGGNGAAGNAGGGNGGGGGAGGRNSTATNGGGSGGGAGYVEHHYAAPTGTASYGVGAAGGAGSAGTSGQAGGPGTIGIIIVEEFFS